MSRPTPWVISAVILLLLFVGLTGCDGDDPAETGAGSLEILAAPASSATPWTLTGPDGTRMDGIASRRLEGLAPGTYELEWTGAEGWVRPWPAAHSIEVGPGQAAVVAGEYRENVPSTVVVSVEPEGSGAAWTLRGSEGAVLSGTGSRILEGLDAGHWTLAWEPSAGWLNTGPLQQSGEAYGGSLAFAARFTADVETPEGFEYVPAGSFTMGSPEEEWGRQHDETAHEVTLTGDLMVSAREISAGQYVELINWAWGEGLVDVDTTVTVVNGSEEIRLIAADALDGSDLELFRIREININFDLRDFVFFTDSPSYPVRGLTWYAAATYCDWLSVRDGLDRAYDHATWTIVGGDPYAVEGYRLPTEAEWEYAARAGQQEGFCSGPVVNPICDDPNLVTVGWHCRDLPSWVGQLETNAWGLYDMHGNVWEWCQDWWVDYPESAVTDPSTPDPAAGPSVQKTLAPLHSDAPVFDAALDLAAKTNPEVRVLRGGSAREYAVTCRSANRAGYDPYWTNGFIGLRPVRRMPDAE